MQDNKLIITHQDGSQNIGENPFLPMQATYAALAADPTAMPELSDETRERILAEIAAERRKKIDEMVLAGEKKGEPKPFYPPAMNRHERRKQAAIARKASKK